VPVIVGLYLIRTRPSADAVTIRGSLLGNLSESLRYVRREPLIRDIYLTVVIISLLVFTYSAMLPLFADKVLHSGAGGYSLLSVAGGLGAVTGALSLAVVRERRRYRGAWIVAGAIAQSIGVALFALSGNIWISAVMLAIVGFSGISFLARANTALQTRVPDEMRGRVMSIYILLLMGVAPVGAVQLGAMAHFFGAPVALAAESLAAAVLIAVLHARRATVRQAA